MEIKSAINFFANDLEKFVNETCQSTITDYKIDLEYGKKNVRVVRREYSKRTGEKIGGSVHCFINLETGDILKAASYKAPAPNGVRGNIFTSPNMGIGTVVTQYGCVYLRG